MHFPMRYFLIVPLTTAVSFLAIGCTESKVSQCNKIIQIANEAVSEAKSVTNGGQSSDPQAMLEAATAMEKASQDMASINVRDETLQDYQAGFVNMYQDTSQATRDFVTAFEKKDRSAAEAALTNLQQATTPEQQLVEDINTYCSGSTGS
jgi:oligoendopeptidase F